MAGPLFWGVDIQKEIGDAMTSTDLPNYTLIKNASASRTSGHQSAGVNGRTLGPRYTIHGSIVQFDQNDLDEGQQIEKDDVCLVIIGKTLDDRGITIELNDFIQLDGKMRSVVWAKHDGARAAWRVQLR